jgi:hypothetical protein
VPIVLKSGSLNFLEPSGPVEASNGIALSFLYTLIYNTGYYNDYLSFDTLIENINQQISHN